jgi:hypothetical protein
MSGPSKAGTAGTRHWKEINRPPPEECWIWLTQSMLESPAWAAMTLAARKVVERIGIEHCAHSLKQNGELTVTYENFVAFGIRRSSIIEAIAIARGLGWIDIIVQGKPAQGTYRVASEYALTWLPRRDGTPPTNRWKGIDEARAERVLAAARDPAWRPKRRARPKPPIGGDIDSSLTSETGELPQNSASASRKSETGQVPKMRLVKA